jgi:hypothetical protein
VRGGCSGGGDPYCPPQLSVVGCNNNKLKEEAVTIFVQTTGTHKSPLNNLGLAPIPGLSLQIPAGSGEQALVILNVPAPYLTRYLDEGGYVAFCVSVDGTTLPANAKFTGPNDVRVPTTLVVAVPLAAKPQTIVALWGGFDVYGHIDSPASLSAMF